MSSADYLDEWYEFDPLKATKSASGIIGTFLGPRSPGSRVRAAPPLHGRDRRRVPRVGLPEGRDRRDQRVDRQRGEVVRRRRSAPTPRSSGCSCATVARLAWRSRTATSSPRRSSCPASTRGARSSISSSRRSCPTTLSRSIANYRFRGSSGKVNLALDALPNFSFLKATVAIGRRSWRTHCAARSRSVRASTTSSARTTMRSTASSRATRTWTSSSRP